MSNEPTTLRDELRKAAEQSRMRPDWTKRRMPTIAPSFSAQSTSDRPNSDRRRPSGS